MSQSLLNIEGVLSASIDAGIKNNDGADLSVIYLTETTTTAAVFTQNVFCAAPVLVAKNHLNHHPKALLINSGNANAGTGSQGMENTLHTCACLAGELNINTEQVLPLTSNCFEAVFSTKSVVKIPLATSPIASVDNLTTTFGMQIGRAHV